MSRPLLVIDAPYLLYRAFYGLPDKIKGADGRPANAHARIDQHDPRRVRRAERPRGGVLHGSRRRPVPGRAVPRLPRPPPADARRSRPPVEARAEALGGARLGHAEDPRARGRRPARRARRGRGGGGRRGADPHRRPRPLPVRDRQGDGAAARRPRQEGARRRSGRPRCAGATASIPSRCPTSSRCAATRPTAFPARRGSARSAPPTSSPPRNARGRAGGGGGEGPEKNSSPARPTSCARSARSRRCASRRSSARGRETDTRVGAAAAKTLGLNGLAKRLEEGAATGRCAGRADFAGPPSTRPSVPKREPWHGQSDVCPPRST